MTKVVVHPVVVSLDDVEDVKVLLTALQFIQEHTDLPLSQREQNVKALLQIRIGQYEMGMR